MTTLTLEQLQNNSTATVRFANYMSRLFSLAAKAWERGNNSGNSDTLAREEELAGKYQKDAETALHKLGVRCSYPGLYPTFTFRDREFHNLLECFAFIKETMKNEQTQPRNLHLIACKYLPCGNTRGARVKLTSHRFGDSITASRNYETRDSSDQGLNILRAMGYTVLFQAESKDRPEMFFAVAEFSSLKEMRANSKKATNENDTSVEAAKKLTNKALTKAAKNAIQLGNVCDEN